MTREQVKELAWAVCNCPVVCPDKDYTDCPHRNAYRRLPVEMGGLGLCPKWQEYVRGNGNV